MCSCFFLLLYYVVLCSQLLKPTHTHWWSLNTDNVLLCTYDSTSRLVGCLQKMNSTDPVIYIKLRSPNWIAQVDSYIIERMYMYMYICSFHSHDLCVDSLCSSTLSCMTLNHYNQVGFISVCVCACVLGAIQRHFLRVYGYNNNTVIQFISLLLSAQTGCPGLESLNEISHDLCMHINQINQICNDLPQPCYEGFCVHMQTVSLY